MSVKVTYRDGSSERLLNDNSAYAEDEDGDGGGEESLAKLLGIKETPDVDPDDNESDTANGLETIDCQFTKGASLVGHSEGVSRQTVEGEEDEEEEMNDRVTAELKNEEDDTSNEAFTNKDGKRDSSVNFEELFGSNLNRNNENPEPKPGTSRSNCNVEFVENDSEGNNPQVTLPPSHKQSFVRGDSSTSRPASAVVSDRILRQRAFLKKQASQKGKILCGLVLIFILVGISLSLLAIAWKLHIGDLFIVGGIFGVGTVLFIILFVFIRYTAYKYSEDHMSLY